MPSTSACSPLQPSPLSLKSGLAYKLTNKLVLRTGHGIYFAPSLGDENPIGFSTNTPWLSTAAGDGIHPGNPISNPFPSGFIQAAGSSQGAATGLGQGITAVLLNHRNGYTRRTTASTPSMRWRRTCCSSSATPAIRDASYLSPTRICTSTNGPSRI